MTFMKIRKNKKGIQLSINFIVMLILAISMFGGGLVFLKKFFSKTQDMKGSLDSQTEQQIEKLLDSGSLVVIPIHTKEIFRSKSDTFGVGVLADVTANYILEAQFQTAFAKDKTTICSPNSGCSVESWLLMGSGELIESKKISKNEKGRFLIMVDVPSDAKRGTYVFKLQVHKQLEGAVAKAPYDYPLEMIVRVP
ncbi:hypothetical protein HN587_03870 [Candidatus Woesearchaeota archaeon]|jgi:hypothetical protein|nr:hypothetical protein [Candidatus Woesearchaeota archaeon]